MQQTDKRTLIDKINKLKKEKNAIILAHCYQNVEVDEVADFVGDSLGLSQLAAKTDAKIIVFLGVTFMAETAKILSPDKKVLIPSLNAGCGMADMVNLEQLREFKAKYPNVPAVCYVNSTAEVKSEVDICCTSSNAINVVKSLNAKKVLFLPDENLGNWVAKNLPEVEIVTYNGCCPIHKSITTQEIKDLKQKYPNAKVLIHPECTAEVLALGDFIGSTTQIMKYIKDNNYNSYIIVTEKGVVDRLQRDYPQKEFILVSPKAYCPNMKRNCLEDVLRSLENEEHEIFVDKEIAKKALLPIERMVSTEKN